MAKKQVTFTYSHTIGFLANTGRGFNNPVDLAMDSKGTLFVLNRAGPENAVRLPYKRVTICTVDEEWHGEFGAGGTAVGEFWWPSSIAIDRDDRVYVLDEGLNRVTIFDRQGSVLGSWGEEGSGPGQLDRPSCMVFDSEDNLLMTDSGSHRVQKFTRDGEFIETWGQHGGAPGQLDTPWGLALDSAGSIFVGDWRNDRVQKFGAWGDYLDQFPRMGEEPPHENRIRRPAGVAVDGDGNIYVCDWGNERVRVLSSQGELLTTIRGDSVDSKWAADYFLANPEEGRLRQEADLVPDLDLSGPAVPPARRDREVSANTEKLLWGPTAIKLDDQGRVYIVDSCRHRIQVYQKNG